jgi:hypothetical protein
MLTTKSKYRKIINKKPYSILDIDILNILLYYLA